MPKAAAVNKIGHGPLALSTPTPYALPRPVLAGQALTGPTRACTRPRPTCAPAALHVLDPDFRAFSLNERTQTLARQLGFQDPLVLQSMVIYKVSPVSAWAAEQSPIADVPRARCPFHATASTHRWRRCVCRPAASRLPMRRSSPGLIPVRGCWGAWQSRRTKTRRSCTPSPSPLSACGLPWRTAR